MKSTTTSSQNPSPTPRTSFVDHPGASIALTNYAPSGESGRGILRSNTIQQANANPKRVRILFPPNNQVQRVRSMEDSSVVSLPSECIGRDEQGRIVLQNCNVVINTVESQREMGQERTLSNLHIVIRPKSAEELQAEKEKREKEKRDGKYRALVSKLDDLLSLARVSIRLGVDRKAPLFNFLVSVLRLFLEERSL